MKLRITPTYKQHLVYEALRQSHEVFFGGGAGGGKSWLICESRLINCYRYPGYKSFIAREELKRLMASTYVTWCKVCRHHGIPETDWKLNGQYNYIEFKNGSRVDLLDAKRLPSDPLYERFGSLEYTDGAFEEAGEIDFLAFDVLKTRIGRHLNKELDIPATALITGNPKKNWTYTRYYLPHKNGTLDSEASFIQSLYSDNPYTAEAYGKVLSNISDEATRQRLKLGNWDYDSDPSALIDGEVIENIWTNDWAPIGQRYIIADIARYGSDRAIITYWEGLRLCEFITFDISSTTEIQQAITALRVKHLVPLSNILVDEDGVGGGVKDNLNCKGFVNNSTAFNPAYSNLKSECGYKLAEMIRDIFVDCDMSEREREILRQDLAQLKTFDSDKDGKLKIMPKEKIKDNIQRSPDWLDVFIMRMWFFVAPVQRGIHTIR